MPLVKLLGRRIDRSKDVGCQDWYVVLMSPGLEHLHTVAYKFTEKRSLIERWYLLFAIEV